jgi:hypothetical protein
MIQELNQQLKSMYLEPRNKLRVDVDYVVGRLDDIVEYIELQEFINELKENMENHNGN